MREATSAHQGGADALASCKIFYEDGACVMATHRNVSVFVWGKQATLPLIAHVEAVAEHLKAGYPSGNSTVHVILEHVPLPDTEARAKLRTLTERYADKLACNAAVIAGAGFWASAMRGLITGIHWLNGRQFKSRTCGSLEEVAAWLPAPHLEITSVLVEEEELLAALRSLRARVH